MYLVTNFIKILSLSCYKILVGKMQRISIDVYLYKWIKLDVMQAQESHNVDVTHIPEHRLFRRPLLKDVNYVYCLIR